MVSKKRKSLALMFGMALALMSISALMPGCSSNGTVTGEERYATTLLSTLPQENKALLDSIAVTDEFQECVESMKRLSKKIDTYYDKESMDNEVEDLKRHKDVDNYIFSLTAKANAQEELQEFMVSMINLHEKLEEKNINHSMEKLISELLKEYVNEKENL